MINPRGFYFHQCNYNKFYGNEISGDISIWFTDYSSHNVIYENNINNSHVQLDDSFSNTIYRNNMTKCGVTLVSSSNNSISGNYMNGISLWQSNCNNILGNSAIGNDQYCIRLSESSGNILKNNKMVDNHYNFYIYGETASDFVNDIDTSNTVDSRPIYYWINKRDSTVPSGAGYVALINCTLITVKNQSLVSNGQGILLINTTDSTVIENNITNNLEGIRLSESSGNSIFENNIKANNWYGVGLQDSSNNKFYHNNLVNNTHQVYIDRSFNNVWDHGYPSGGNYWSDYNGTDSDQDGIGDTPYVIDANNTDNYPMMGMFYGFAIMWQEKTYVVNIISNSTVSGIGYAILTTFQWQNHTIIEDSFESIYFYVSGEDGAYGFCRVHIPIALLNSPYRVSVNSTEVPYALLPCSNITNSYLYFTYAHSTERVEITPEFPSLLVLPLFMMATLLAVIVHKRKHIT